MDGFKNNRPSLSPRPFFSGETKTQNPKKVTTSKRVLMERNGSSDIDLGLGGRGTTPSLNGSDDQNCPPYDPVTNYLSPRPKFLRYKPNRRLERFLQRDLEHLHELQSESDSRPPESEDDDIEDDDIEDGDGEDEERPLIFNRVMRALLLFGVLVIACSYVSSTPSFGGFGGLEEDSLENQDLEWVVIKNPQLGCSNISRYIWEVSRDPIPTALSEVTNSGPINSLDVTEDIDSEEPEIEKHMLISEVSNESATVREVEFEGEFEKEAVFHVEAWGNEHDIDGVVGELSDDVLNEVEIEEVAFEFEMVEIDYVTNKTSEILEPPNQEATESVSELLMEHNDTEPHISSISEAQNGLDNMDWISRMKRVMMAPALISVVAATIVWMLFHFMSRRASMKVSSDSKAVKKTCAEPVEDTKMSENISLVGLSTSLQLNDNINFSRNCPPVVELLGEVEVTELSTPERRFGAKLKAPCVKNVVSSTTPLKRSAKKSTPSPDIAFVSPSVSSVMKKGNGGAESMKEVTTTTPVRRSSRLRNKAMSP